MAKKRRNVTYEKFDKVIQLIENEGLSLRKALKQVGFSSETFNEILNEDENRAKHYARAREIRADYLFEEILEIAYNQEIGEKVSTSSDGKVTIETGDLLGHRKLKIDSIKWMLGKMQPKKYGDKLDVTTDGEKLPANTPSAINVTIVQPIDEDE